MQRRWSVPNEIRDTPCNGAVALPRTRKTVRRRARWFRHVAVYAIGIGGLALIDLVSGGGLSWFLYPAIVWGVGLGIHALSAFQRR